jgi:hypothetical protein
LVREFPSLTTMWQGTDFEVESHEVVLGACPGMNAHQFSHVKVRFGPLSLYHHRLVGGKGFLGF